MQMARVFGIMGTTFPQYIAMMSIACMSIFEHMGYRAKSGQTAGWILFRISHPVSIYWSLAVRWPTLNQLWIEGLPIFRQCLRRICASSLTIQLNWKRAIHLWALINLSHFRLQSCSHIIIHSEPWSESFPNPFLII